MSSKATSAPAQALKVLICGQHFPFALQHIQQELLLRDFDSHTIIDTCATEEVPEKLHSYDVASPFMSQITREMINSTEDSKLKLILQFGAGLEGVDQVAAAERNIQVKNIPSASTGNAAATAEHAMYLLLSALRQPAKAEKYFQNQILGGPLVTQISGKNVIIFGFGGVSSELLQRLTPFSPRTISIIKRTPLEPKRIQSLVESCKNFHTDLKFIFENDESSAEEKAEALKQGDIIILGCPVTETTRGMVDKDFLDNCKAGVVVINVARGQLVDHASLLDALESSQVSFFCTDVGCSIQHKTLKDPSEPFPPTDPLAKHPNTFFTPHVGGVADISYTNMARIFVDHLQNLQVERTKRRIKTK